MQVLTHISCSRFPTQQKELLFCSQLVFLHFSLSHFPIISPLLACLPIPVVFASMSPWRLLPWHTAIAWLAKLQCWNAVPFWQLSLRWCIYRITKSVYPHERHVVCICECVCVCVCSFLPPTHLKALTVGYCLPASVTYQTVQVSPQRKIKKSFSSLCVWSVAPQYEPSL